MLHECETTFHLRLDPELVRAIDDNASPLCRSPMYGFAPFLPSLASLIFLPVGLSRPLVVYPLRELHRPDPVLQQMIPSLFKRTNVFFLLMAFILLSLSIVLTFASAAVVGSIAFVGSWNACSSLLKTRICFL